MNNKSLSLKQNFDQRIFDPFEPETEFVCGEAETKKFNINEDIDNWEFKHRSKIRRGKMKLLQNKNNSKSSPVLHKGVVCSGTEPGSKLDRSKSLLFTH